MQRGLQTRASPYSLGRRPKKGWRAKPRWPSFSGDVFAFTEFTESLVGYVQQLQGKSPVDIIVTNISRKCLPVWLVNLLCADYVSGVLDLPSSTEELLEQVFQIICRPQIAQPYIVKRIQDWDPVPNGDAKAELRLISDYLDLYQLSDYYGIDDAFLTFKVLEEFAVKVTDSMIQDMQGVIGSEIEDDRLPGKVVQYLRLRQKVLLGGPEWFRETEQHSAMVKQEEQRSAVVGAIVTKQVEADIKVSLDYSSEEDEASPLQVNNCTFRHCQEEEHHSPADCKYFLSLSKTQRKKEVSRKARCFLCLNKDHTAKVCSASNQVKAKVRELTGVSFDPGM